MEPFADIAQLQESLQGVVKLRQGSELRLLVPQMFRGELVDRFVYTSILGGTQKLRHLCSLILRSAALAHGIWCDSIHPFYKTLSTGRKAVMTIPAYNVRGLTYSIVRTIFRTAQKLNAGPFIIEISPHEMSFTQQRADEIGACVLGAALRENYFGPVFIQGDHFKIDAHRSQQEKLTDTNRMQSLISDAIGNGFYNFDIDATHSLTCEHQAGRDALQDHFERVARVCEFIRQAQPQGVTAAMGVEFGSMSRLLTQKDLVLREIDMLQSNLAALQVTPGLTKICFHLDSDTNAMDNGLVPHISQSLSQEVLSALSGLSVQLKSMLQIAGLEIHAGSGISHSVLDNLPSNGIVEVHLGTQIQDIIFDHPRFPIGLTEEIHSYLETHCSMDLQAQTSRDYFYYTARKKSWGPFKKAICSLDERTKAAILQDIEKEVSLNFELLRVAGQRNRLDEVYPEPTASLAVMPKF